MNGIEEVLLYVVLLLVGIVVGTCILFIILQFSAFIMVFEVFERCKSQLISFQVIIYHICTCHPRQILPTFRQLLATMVSCRAEVVPAGITESAMEIIPGVNDNPPRYSQSSPYEKVLVINYLPSYETLFDKHAV